MNRWCSLLLSTLLLSQSGEVLAEGENSADDVWKVWQVLESDPFTKYLSDASKLQISESKSKLKVPYDFLFSDRLRESGITFKHNIVDDAGKFFKPVHYDHGNAVAVADVDGDTLLDLYFVNQVGSNELWKNLGGGQFENRTLEAGVGLSSKIGVAASFADVDNDGDPDLYVTTVRGGNSLFVNRGNGTFEDRTEQSGLGYVGHSSGSQFFDFDNDGDLDLLLTNVGTYTSDQRGASGYFVGLPDAFAGHLKPERAEQSLLFENRGDLRFVDISHEVGFNDSSWSGDALVVDLDGDNFLDLYIPNMQGDDHYYRNFRGRSLLDETVSFFPKTPWGSMGIVQLDFDNNGFMDIFVTDMHSDMVEEQPPDREHLKAKKNEDENYLQGGFNNIWGNAFYRNLGLGRLVEESDPLGAETFWPWGVSAADLNADGWEDLFITSSMNFPYRYANNVVLMNNEGNGFVRSEFLLGVEPRREGRTHTPWFDLDCIGEDKPHFMCDRRPGQKWHVWAAIGSRSSVAFDLDKDGDLDIVTLDFNSEPQVLLSDLAERGAIHSLEIELRGTRSNRDGIGANVKVQLGDRTLHRFYNGKSGYLAQSSFPVYIGMGTETEAHNIEVSWPSGCHQVVPGPHRSGATVSIVETCPDTEE